MVCFRELFAKGEIKIYFLNNLKNATNVLFTSKRFYKKHASRRNLITKNIKRDSIFPYTFIYRKLFEKTLAHNM